MKPVWSLCLLIVFQLLGCASTPHPAPIQERGKVPAPPPLPDRYLVKPGDNLFRIALEHGLDYRDLARWNGITNPDYITAGTYLRLRPPAGSAEENKPIGANAQSARKAQAVESEASQLVWTWPVKGKVIAPFDERAGRKGIQIAAPYGAPVLAAASGRVVYTGQALRGYGKLTIIRHNKVFLSVYAHQSRILVKEGDMVARGQKIGEVGDTDAKQAKLHFEIRAYGKPVNPADYLPG